MNAQQMIHLALALACLNAGVVHADDGRNPAVVRAWRKTHPCPSTGKTTGPCPGWVADHAVPLCWDPKGDVPTNLIWQETAQSYRKDVFERAACSLKAKP